MQDQMVDFFHKIGETLYEIQAEVTPDIRNTSDSHDNSEAGSATILACWTIDQDNGNKSDFDYQQMDADHNCKPRLKATFERLAMDEVRNGQGF